LEETYQKVNISVIIPLYNKENFVTKTIQSVLDQKHADFELIIVNDGSTDQSLKKAEAFKDPRISIINIPGSGVSVARNKGADLAAYNWIAYLDADDWWAPDFLSEMVQAIKAYPNHHLFSSGRSRVFENKTERYKNEFLPEDGETNEVNYLKIISRHLPLINSSNTVIRKSHFKVKGYFWEDQSMHEDHDLWLRLSIEEPVIFVNKNLSFYRIDEQLSASKLYYKPADFKIFLKTMLKVRDQISHSDKKYFQSYCNRFILFTFIKYYSKYTKKEEQMIYGLSKKLMKGNHLLFLKILKVLPFKNTYPIFKYLHLK
jgi:glycosyltransferase involved in cell wall biosynthesis